MPWPYDGSSSISERERSRAYQALAQLPDIMDEHPAKERERRRYEIARECVAAAFGRDIMPDEYLLVRQAVQVADDLLAALEEGR